MENIYPQGTNRSCRACRPVRDLGFRLMSVARLRLAPVRETMFPSRAPFFVSRLGSRAAEIAARAEEKGRGNLPVSPYAPSPAHGQQVGP